MNFSPAYFILSVLSILSIIRIPYLLRNKNYELSFQDNHLFLYFLDLITDVYSSDPIFTELSKVYVLIRKITLLKCIGYFELSDIFYDILISLFIFSASVIIFCGGFWFLCITVFPTLLLKFKAGNHQGLLLFLSSDLLVLWSLLYCRIFRK